jgi:hypothetical protein
VVGLLARFRESGFGASAVAPILSGFVLDLAGARHHRFDLGAAAHYRADAVDRDVLVL